jgi:hypothetical protein
MANEKGGMDVIVLQQALIHYIKVLYPYTDDVPGKQVLVKFAVGPGRLDIKSFA